MFSQGLVLDVGCGHMPHGDVNVDISIQPTIHRTGELTASPDRTLDLKRIPNFVLASADALPFRDNAFLAVISRHVIEHVRDPWTMFRELVRVSMAHVQLELPHRLGDNPKNVAHVNKFGKRWFYHQAQKLGCHAINVRYEMSRPKQFPRFPIPFQPYLLHIDVWK